ncbi:MAG: NAD(P)H-hydrate dehydratase [Pseudomonadota bacterium]|nr:NAD(P)H-hydrate dehydratase [Pseudomonadota bacterium]
MRAISRIYTGDQVRALDRILINKFDVPGISLMKRAGLFAFDRLCDRWPGAASISVVCGSGNNAGDGYIVAGLAHNRGIRVQLIQIGSVEGLKGDAETAYRWSLEQGVIPEIPTGLDGDVVVDAMLGTGSVGSIRDSYVAGIDLINEHGAPVVALDIPTGISADTGALGTQSPVKADLTTTFIGAKLGLFTGPGVDFAGQIELSELDAPQAAFEQVQGLSVIPRKDSERAVSKRPIGAHKNNFGHVLIVGGDHGMCGAVLLAAESALRTGAGLVSVITRSENRSAIVARRPEVMVYEVDGQQDIGSLLNRANVIAVGPGLGQGAWGRGILQRMLDSGKECVVDADALNFIAHESWALPAGSILTPHPGEASRLLGITTDSIQADRPTAARTISAKYKAVTVLTGAGTLIANGGELLGICIAGNSGMATAGSGDVLTGIVAAAKALGIDATTAAALGVWLHASSGDRANTSVHGRAIIASDIVESLRPYGESSSAERIGGS